MQCVGIKDDEIPEIRGILDAADLLGLHVNTVRLWVKKGDLPAFQVSGLDIDFRARVGTLIVGASLTGEDRLTPPESGCLGGPHAGVLFFWRGHLA